MNAADAHEGKIGLALGAGVARGWSHIGVIQALADAGIKPDIIAGTSIGAVVGGCHAAGSLDALEDFARTLNRRRIFGYLDFNLTGTGLIHGQRLGQTLHEALGDCAIEDLSPKFVAIATEIGTGHEVWLSQGALVDAICASYALPGIFRPVRVNRRWLFDGALVNPVPVSVCRALGARYVIAVNLNFDLTSRGTLAPQIQMSLDDAHADGNAKAVEAGQEDFADGALNEDDTAVRPRRLPNAKRLLRRQLLKGSENAPGISTVVVDAFNIVQDRIARSRLAGDPPDVMISPKLQGIGLFDFHRAADLIERGRASVERELETIHSEIEVRRKHGVLKSA
ncbi:MAG: patatin-like phospholipase family protein [Pseudomonadota bacterium]